MTEDKELRQQWLDSLKEGDSVALKSRSWGGEARYTLRTVLRITPKRRIIIGGDLTFKDDGRPYGHQVGNIIPVTNEVIGAIKKEKMLRLISSYDFKKLPFGNLEQIYDIIKAYDSSI